MMAACASVCRVPALRASPAVCSCRLGPPPLQAGHHLPPEAAPGGIGSSPNEAQVLSISDVTLTNKHHTHHLLHRTVRAVLLLLRCSSPMHLQWCY
jgi:hypothetical protein